MPNLIQLDRRSLLFVPKSPTVLVSWVLDRACGLAHVESSFTGQSLSRVSPDLVSCCNCNNFIFLSKQSNLKPARQLQGTLHSLLKNMMEGLRFGSEIQLKLNGVGYKARIDGQTIVLDVGFSHLVKVPIPPSIQASLPDANTIIVKSLEKDKLGLFSSTLRTIRPPEPYKGKGIQYVNETIVLKAGKSKR